ncbi:MAG: hypothetical protein LUD17_13280 [Bacteroidales bacterium]|nr:hypothetical protein [Bacteroidales bacterium]
MKSWIISIMAVAAMSTAASPKYTINSNWNFEGPYVNLEAASAKCPVRVDLPHSWNAVDATDDVNGYGRGIGRYTKLLRLGAEIDGKQVYLHFEGANQATRVWVNGAEVGSHRGGYTAFVFDITPYVVWGENLLEVEVDNSHKPAIPPLSADYTFFGGIYRDVSIEIEEPVHISHADYASSGVYIATPQVSADQAKVEITTLIHNACNAAQDLVIEQSIYAPDGTLVKSISNNAKALPNTSKQAVIAKFSITNPQLWSIDCPQRYSVVTRLQDKKTKRTMDTQTDYFGLRWFDFSPNTGFTLNDKPLKLIGTNRHQDFKGKGWAVTDDHHIRDLKLLKEMGGNYLRVSHYPQDPLLMDLCDQLGILTSVEIPIVNAITESQEFLDNCLEMQTEMVKQNFNRPSVIIWAYMNEVMLVPPYKRGTPEYQAYCTELHRQAVAIDSLTKAIDPSRATLIPFHNNMDSYADADLYDVADVVGWNMYPGWYSGSCTDLEKFLEEYHAKHPTRPTIMTEYGADCDSRLHSDIPQRFDFTMDYADIFHEHYLNAVKSLPYLAGASLWNLNEFYSEGRGSAMPHVNPKGIVTLDRKPKNTYYLYKANFTTEPFVQFANADWTHRAAQLDSLGAYETEIKVYTNQPELKVSVNGAEPEPWAVSNGVGRKRVALNNGINNLVAVGSNPEIDNRKSVSASLNISLEGIPWLINDDFRELSVMFGSKRTYTNPETQVCWMPEQPYRPGSWGYTGGELVLLKNWAGTLPASDVDILGTDEDPLYQTMRRGLESFRADVPNGRYAIYMHWADLTKEQYETLAYNLGGDTQHEESDDAFNIVVNGQVVLPALDARAEVGRQRPLDVKIEAEATGNEGLQIDFQPVRGYTFLNALRIIRL